VILVKVYIRCNDTFSSYNKLLKRVKAFEETMYSQLVHRDSRTLEAAAKRVPKRVENAKKELLYYTINLTCVLVEKSTKTEEQV